MIHPLSDVQTSSIGEDTKVWQFSVILAGAEIGRNCNICAHTFIENDVCITIQDNVFIGPNATFTNDKKPRSKQYPDEFPKTVVEFGASIGANATILPGLTLGRRCLIGAGAVVTKDVPAYSIVTGNPAKVIGSVDGND